jgi:hypothetical protein
MSDCRLEPDVLRAAARGEWTESLRAHVATCADCAVAAEIAPWMQQFARMDDREHKLPDPASLWVRAKLLQSTAAADRASLPITRVQIASYLVVAGCWAALLTWKWSALSAWINSFTPAHVILGAAGAETAASLSATFFLMLIVLASVTAMLAFQTILAEE